MAIDLLGGVFSNLSLVFREDVDVIAVVAYSLVVVCVTKALLHFSTNLYCVQALDAIVIICALILNPRAKRRRKRAAETLTQMVNVHEPETAMPMT
jgi:Flp pilus assembly protein TadB